MMLDGRSSNYQAWCHYLGKREAPDMEVELGVRICLTCKGDLDVPTPWALSEIRQ